MNNTSRGNFRAKSICTIVALLALATSKAQTNTQLSVTNAPPAPRRPSILVILADNIGYGDIGCYGQTKIKTPRLDQLASEGIRFTSYYVGSPDDQASRASLLTGLRSDRIGATFGHPLPIDAVTVAAHLQKAGYHTGFIGEWNLGDTPPVEPNTKGFNEFAGFLSRAHALNYFSDIIYRQDTATGTNMAEWLSDNRDGARGKYVPDLLGTIAANLLRINQPTKLNHYQPFFLCLSYPVPHNGIAPDVSIYSGESWPQAEKDRASIITHMDENIGHLLDELAKSKADTNTVVIFTSLGGPQAEGATNPKFFNSAGPLRGEAGSVYEGGIRVPMIVRWPARIEPGQVSDFAWAAWDFMPTAADIALMKPLAKTDGLSILPVLTGKGKTNEHESFYWESKEGSPQQAVRMGDWKLVSLGTNAPELYNLKTDIGEQDNGASTKPEVVKTMEALLKRSSN